MPRVSPQELLSCLEKGKVIPAILLLGDEPYLRDACRAQLIEKFVPEASRTWAVSRYSAERGETEAALSQAQSLPMLSPQQAVFLEDAEAIEKLGDKNREETVTQLEVYLGDPAPFTVHFSIRAEDEHRFIANAIAPLTPEGIAIFGMPSLESQTHASPQSKAGHVNCKTGDAFKRTLERHFHTVFMFSMNDEVVHTGFYPMAHYLLGVACHRRATMLSV